MCETDISHYCPTQHLIAHRDQQGEGRVVCPLFLIINFCVIVPGYGPLRLRCVWQIPSTLHSKSSLSMLTYGTGLPVMKSARVIGLADKRQNLDLSDNVPPCVITWWYDDTHIHTTTRLTRYSRQCYFCRIKMRFLGAKTPQFVSNKPLFYSSRYAHSRLTVNSWYAHIRLTVRAQ